MRGKKDDLTVTTGIKQCTFDAKGTGTAIDTYRAVRYSRLIPREDGANQADKDYGYAPDLHRASGEP